MPGWINSLSAKLIQLTAPGVPDVYQGSELWEMSLVDPDNRRPVDFELRRRLLGRPRPRRRFPPIDETGAAKLLVTSRALRLRRDRPDLFTRYAPLAGATDRRRGTSSRSTAARPSTVATRLPVGLGSSRRLGRHHDRARRPTVHRRHHRPRVRQAARARSPTCSTRIPSRCSLPVAVDDRADDATRCGRRCATRRAARGRRRGPPDEPPTATAGGAADESRRAPRSDYGYLARRRPDAVARPAVALAAGRRRTALSTRLRPVAVRVDGRPLDAAASWPARSSTSCTSARSPRTARSTPPSNGSTTSSTSASTSSSCCRSTPSTARTTGATTVCSGTPSTTATAGRQAYQRFVDACHGRGLGVIQDVVYNHLGPSGNYLPRFGPYLHDEHANTWGAVGQPRASPRSAATSSTTPRCGSATTTSTGCASTPCTRSSTRRRRTSCRSSPRRSTRSSAFARPPAHADRRVRPQRPEADHAAGGRRLRAARAVERRLPPRRARRAHRRDDGLLRRLRTPRRARQGHDQRASSTTARTRRSAVATTAGRSTPSTMPAWRLVVANQNHDQIGNRAAGDRLVGHARRRPARHRRRAHADRPVHADAVHGRGVGRARRRGSSSPPIPSRSSAAATAEGRIAEFARMGWDRDVVPDPQDAVDVRELEARLVGAGRRMTTPGCCRCTAS